MRPDWLSVLPIVTTETSETGLDSKSPESESNALSTQLVVKS